MDRGHTRKLTIAPVIEQAELAQCVTGTIASVRPNDATGDAIHFISPDGTGDRMI